MFESVVLEQIGDTQAVVGLIYSRKWEALTQEGRDDIWKDWRCKVLHIDSAREYYNALNDCYVRYSEHSQLFDTLYIGKSDHIEDTKHTQHTTKWEALTQEGRDDIWKDWRCKVLHIDSAREYYNALNDCYVRYSEHSQLFDTLYIGKSDHIEDSKDAASMILSMLPKPPKLTVAEHITTTFAKSVSGKL